MKYGWSLNREYWNLLRDMCDGFQWRRVRLEPQFTGNIPLKSGVYLICASTENMHLHGEVMNLLYNAIYAGQSKNLNDRFKRHVRGERDIIQAKLVFRVLDFWYAEIPRVDLDAVEDILIKSFGPIANTLSVKASLGEGIPAGQRR